VKSTLLLLVTLFVPAVVTRQAHSPRQIADELVAADRAFAAASARTDLITGISSMFAADVAMPTPTGIAYGSQKAADALRANPANSGAKAEWTPVRVALSSDGKHGFTAGFMSITRADGSVSPAKYLAYWERQAGGWRVLVYKRAPTKAAAPVVAVSYLLPKQITASKNDAAAVEKHRESLSEAERSFSREAQTMGIGEAFKNYGSPDAINLGGPDTVGFTMGNQAIGDSVGSGVAPNTSPVNWGPEKTVIAASGDFGVTIGYIVRNKPGEDGKIPPGHAFFTIWRRDSSGAWRYVAE
jgi:ketosteroid isomerase-like protein